MQEDDAVKRIALLLLVAACGGKYQAPPPVASIALPDGSQLNPYDSTKPGKARPHGRVPNGVAATANKIWTGDAFTTTVFSIDRKTFAADPSAPVAVDCAKSKFSYVADVMTIRGDVYALCASDTSGELYRLDPDGG